MSDPANTKLGRMVLDEITPVVMVLRTQLVENSCRKNGLSLIEMLAPFSNFNNIDVPVRTASDQPYRLRKFKLRLYYASEIRQPNIEHTKDKLRQVINLAGEMDDAEIHSGAPEIESLIDSKKKCREAKKKTNAQISEQSWFQNFNRELINAVSFSEHEAFDHPVACLVAVSSKDQDPINKFVDLFNTNQFPSLLNDGAMDPKILKHFLLVHDNQDGMLEKTMEILSEMRSTFGANACRLLCINSSGDSMVEHQENPWASYKSSCSNEQPIGCFLNVDDIEELRSTMHDLSSKHIIPRMEVKIRVLNQQVSVTRKGFRNQIKNLWWRKGKDDAAENPNGPMYTFSSIESQIRVLGDHAFMLHDYELALSNYRLISTDYKLDKAWKHYAGVQEMMGLAYFMLDQSRKDAEFCMEHAFNTYLKIGASGMHSATRCGIWWAEMLKARDQFKDAASVYFRVSGEEPLHSAVMLEQASYCFLLSTPTMLRKCGFHLVLSGDLYRKSDQITHAIRTYTYALSAFKGTSWRHIGDHVHFHIGKWYAFLGMYDEAIKHLLEVLTCGHQSKATQELFLREFFQIIKERGEFFEVSRLQLPAINPPSIKVIFEDHRTYASSSPATVRESMWRSLEQDMIPSQSAVKSNWLESQSKALPKTFKKSNVCVAGETIKVELGFQNPLQIPLSVSNVSLICKHSAQHDEIEQDTSGLVSNYQSDKEFTNSVSGEFNSDVSLFTLSKVDILMGGGETILVQLTVTPRVEGTLKLLGVRWKLSDSVVGSYEFNSDIIKKKVPKGRRKPSQSIKDSLQFLVIKSQPRLEGVIHNLPKSVYAGDLRRLILELRNPSRISVKNLKMRISNPRFLAFADQEVVDLDFPSGLRKQEDSSKIHLADDAAQANSIFVFPDTVAISSEIPLQWPLWFRAATTGSISLYITIYYEMRDGSSIIAYRTLRMQYNLEVLPSLEVSFRTSPCPSRLQEFLVRMDIVNRTSSEGFHIHQLSCLGDQWDVALLQPVDSILSSEILMSGQALSCFLKLKNRRTQGTPRAKISSIDMPRTTDVRLRDGDSTEAFDTSNPPFIHFHHYERWKQEREDQGLGNTVDFILITESHSDSDGKLPRTGISSHHACHCRVTSSSPVWWLMEGPQSVRHDFSVSLCEISLKMIIYNSLEDTVTVRISTLDSLPPSNTSNSNGSVSGNDGGWHDTSHLSEMRVTSNVMGARFTMAALLESVPPFIWSGSNSTRLTLEPSSSAQVPLQVTALYPGTFDLSNYTLHWSIVSSDGGGDDNGSKLSSGSFPGESYHITVLQKGVEL